MSKTNAQRGAAFLRSPARQDLRAHRTSKRSCATVVALSALMSVACSAGNQESESTVEGGADMPSTFALETRDDALHVRAGASGEQLGLERWQFSGEQILGLGANGAVLAEFRIHPEASTIESVIPEAGVVELEHAQPTGTFSQRTQSFFEAMQLDRQQAGIAAEGNASVEPSTFEGCYVSFQRCNETAGLLITILGAYDSCSCTLGASPCGSSGVRLDCF